MEGGDDKIYLCFISRRGGWAQKTAARAGRGMTVSRTETVASRTGMAGLRGRDSGLRDGDSDLRDRDNGASGTAVLGRMRRGQRSWGGGGGRRFDAEGTGRESFSKCQRVSIEQLYRGGLSLSTQYEHQQ